MSKAVEIVGFVEGGRGNVLPVLDLRATDFRAAIDSHVGAGVGTMLLADCRGAEDLQRCDMALSVAEARAGRNGGEVRIIASAADSAAGLLQMPSLGGKSMRLAGLTWDRTAFCGDIRCAPDSAVVEHARIQVIIAARAFGLPAYDSCDPGDVKEEFTAKCLSLGFDGYSLAAD